MAVAAGHGTFRCRLSDRTPPVMADMFAKALTMGGSGLGPARQLLASVNQNGEVPKETSPLNGPARKVPMDDECPVGRGHGSGL